MSLLPVHELSWNLLTIGHVENIQPVLAALNHAIQLRVKWPHFDQTVLLRQVVHRIAMLAMNPLCSHFQQPITEGYAVYTTPCPTQRSRIPFRDTFSY